MALDTPTPTDPREGEIKRLREGCEQWRKIANAADAELAKMIEHCKELEFTNSKLAAEIAELKARLSNEERNADTLAKELATLRDELEAARKERVSDVKPPEIMFAVYAKELGSNNWFEQETNTDEALVREWRDRNNKRSPDLYDPPREYILVRKETTFTKLQ